jgi:hypothetical protein
VAAVIVLLAFHFLKRLAPSMEGLADSEPLSVPVASGVKVTFIFTLCPGERVYGSVGPLTA